MDYKPLRKSFRSKSFIYEEVLREGDFAIYKQTSHLGSVAFEVIRITRHNGYSIAGNKFPPAEMYPSNSQWGILGWTCTTWEDAMKRFEAAKEKFGKEPAQETKTFSQEELEEISEEPTTPEPPETMELPFQTPKEATKSEE